MTPNIRRGIFRTLAIAAFAFSTLIGGPASAGAKPASSQPQGSLIVGEQGACLLDQDGTTRCLSTSNRPDILSANRFAALSIGTFDVTCGLKTDGSAICWGLSSPDPDVVTQAGPWRSVAAGSDFGCGIRTDGRLQCWGGPSPAAVRTLTTETYHQVAAGTGGVCALRNDSTVACWPEAGSTSLAIAPQGRFLQVAIGS